MRDSVAASALRSLRDGPIPQSYLPESHRAPSIRTSANQLVARCSKRSCATGQEPCHCSLAARLMGKVSIHLVFRLGRLLVDTVCRPPLYQEGNVPQPHGTGNRDNQMAESKSPLRTIWENIFRYEIRWGIEEVPKQPSGAWSREFPEKQRGFSYERRPQVSPTASKESSIFLHRS